MRGWIGEETPYGSADASEEGRKVERVKKGGLEGKRELADVGTSSPKPR